MNSKSFKVLVASMRLFAASIFCALSVLVIAGSYLAWQLYVLPPVQEQQLSIELKRASQLKAIEQGLVLPEVKNGNTGTK